MSEEKNLNKQRELARIFFGSSSPEYAKYSRHLWELKNQSKVEKNREKMSREYLVKKKKTKFNFNPWGIEPNYD